MKMKSTTTARHRNGTHFACLLAFVASCEAAVLYTDDGTGRNGTGDLSYSAGDIEVPADGNGVGYAGGNFGAIPMTDVGGGNVGSNAPNTFYGRFLWEPGAPNDFINFSSATGFGRLSFHNAATDQLRMFDVTGASAVDVPASPAASGTTLVVFRVDMADLNRTGNETVTFWYNPTSFADVAAGLNATGTGTFDLFDAGNDGFGVSAPNISGAGATTFDNIAFGDTAADVIQLIPEPSSATLLGLVGATLLLRRKRLS